MLVGKLLTRSTRFTNFFLFLFLFFLSFFYRATRLRCNPEKDKKNKRVRTMRTWYSRQSRHVANIVSACHCCTYDLLITQGLYSTWRRRYHETLETFGHVLALGTEPNIYSVYHTGRDACRGPRHRLSYPTWPPVFIPSSDCRKWKANIVKDIQQLAAQEIAARNTRAKRREPFCTAPHSKIQLNFVKHFRIFTVSLNSLCKFKFFCPNFTNFDFLRFRTENYWNFRRMIVEKLEQKLEQIFNKS